MAVDDLAHYHKNARLGNVARVASSLKVNGQYKPIVVNVGTHTGRGMEVLAGNHVLKAAKQLGWKRIAVHQVDLTEAQAARLVLADNKTSDDSTYDEKMLDEILADVLAVEDLEDLEGTGYTELDYLDAQARLEAPEDDGDDEEGDEGYDQPDVLQGATQGLGTPVISYVLVFDDADQQKAWYRALAYLRENEDGDTIAERLTAHFAPLLED